MKIKPLPHALFLAAALLGACGSEGTTATDTKPLSPAQRQAKIEQLKLHFNGPVLIDSSVYVMYPLLLNSAEYEYIDDSSIGSKSNGRSNTYWNIAFYNTETGESHLLSTTRKMVIYAYSEENAGGNEASVSAAAYAAYVKSGYRPLNKRIYYSVRTVDFNHDGVLDESDPGYLFTSDKSGHDFRQISPDNYQVTNWQLVHGPDKVLMQGLFDSTNNQQFDEQDVPTPMVYSPRPGGPAKAVFEAPFGSSVKQLLDAQWVKKP